MRPDNREKIYVGDEKIGLEEKIRVTANRATLRIMLGVVGLISALLLKGLF